nr:MAG TPA_asm: hypothetical protein [Caudoviricetes sp.]
MIYFHINRCKKCRRCWNTERQKIQSTHIHIKKEQIA